MDKFETLNDETAILMLNQDTLTVARLKKLIQNQLYERLSRSYYSQGEGRNIIVSDYFCPDLTLLDEELKISMNDFQLQFPPEGQECKRLNFETKEWQTGKLRILADVKILGDESSDEESINVEINQMTIEFASDSPTFEYESSESESSLDEIRNSN